MLTVKQVAERLAVSQTCVYQLIATGKLACHRIGIGRGAIRVGEDDLAAFVESSRTPAESCPPPKPQKLVSRRQFKHLRLDR